LAETNRTPFDFAEGESELVSDFNVEYYGGGDFSLIFLAEYASILFMRLLFCIIFFG
jgi:NADH-ubiquinone oxidoreductase chain 1